MKTIVLPFTTAPDPDGPLLAVLEPQTIVRPTALYLDGKVIPLPDAQALTPGQTFELELPAGTKENCSASFAVEEIDIRNGPFETGPVRVSKPTIQSTFASAVVRRRTKKTVHVIGPESTFLFQVAPQFIGRVRKIRATVRQFCGVCGGTLFVGLEDRVPCPACQKSETARYAPSPSRGLFVESLGTYFQFPSAGAIPLAAFESDLPFQSRAFLPGVLVTLQLHNPARVAVEIEGELECDELDESDLPMPPMPGPVPGDFGVPPGYPPS